MPRITVNGAAIAYTDTGTPPGLPGAPAIVFGHGLLFGGWMFRPQVAELRQRYRCVTIDWRGQGDSAATPGGYDMESLTADAVALIRELAVAPAHWVGLSMGGFVGQRVAARHGELLRSLTLLSTSADAEDPVSAREYKRLALVQRFLGLGPVLGKVKPHVFGPAFLASPAGLALAEEWAARLGRCDRAAIRKAVLGVVDRAPVAREVAGIRVPALIVAGADDKTMPRAHAERIAAAIPGARLEIVAECGHSATLEQPDVITGLLRSFLHTVDASPGRGPGPG